MAAAAESGDNADEDDGGDKKGGQSARPGGRYVVTTLFSLRTIIQTNTGGTRGEPISMHKA